ncbi:hypothetical protein EAG_15136 [Camponotus floridanus]|uniref:Uncharacterized protein n=1 Tax=Camponotus floridanus TaxID=104421 RepID=E1ZYN7_CAMFO|nr:hypothetical protein EAG_15136 [Camponotus floridanus]
MSKDRFLRKGCKRELGAMLANWLPATTFPEYTGKHHYMKCLRLKLSDNTHHIKPEIVQALIYEAVNVSDKIQPSVLLRPFDAILEARISLLETFLPVTLTYLTTMSSHISQRINETIISTNNLDEWVGGWFWRQKSEPRRVVLPGYCRTTVTPSPIRRSSAVPRPPPALWRHPRLPLHHLLHLLDDAIPSFIISCTSDFENSNNFLLPPGWRAKRGGERGGRGWPGLRGLVLPAVWRWFQVADAGAALFVWYEGVSSSSNSNSGGSEGSGGGGEPTAHLNAESGSQQPFSEISRAKVGSKGKRGVGSREATKLPIKSTFAGRISPYLFRFTNGVESSWKKQRDISRAITKLGVLAILRGNIEDATTRKFMAGTKESNIVVASEPMCLPPAIPAGRIETAKVVESPEAPRDYLGKRICRSLPGPISPKRASSKRTSSMAGPGPIDSHPRAGAPPESPYPAILRRTRVSFAVSVFLGLWRQSCRAAPDGLSESPLLI